MKKFRFRGKDRIVGACRIPSPAELATHHARGMLHELLGTPVSPVTAPAVTNWWAAATAALATMLLNDQLGDCAIAEDLHLDAVRCANAGATWVPTDAQAQAEYSIVTGYVPGDAATDQGTDPMQLMAWRKANAYPSGAKLLGFPAVDASKGANLQQGIWLAEGVYGFASLPDAWESEENQGDVWDVAGPPNPQNGHAFGLVDIDVPNQRCKVTTWGEFVWLTFAAAAKYLVPSAGGGCMALLCDDAISKITGKAGNGYDLTALGQYLGVSVPAPAPVPPPAPPASAPGVVDLGSGGGDSPLK